MPARAPALATLLAQINAAAPSRSKASDGWIGDTAHQTRKSDHNPDPAGIVHAIDVTHDPPRFDARAMAEHLRTARDQHVSYVISNRRIFAGVDGPSPFVWRAYTGASPHDKHVHVSVRRGAPSRDTKPWQIAPPWRLAALALAEVKKDLGPRVGAGAILLPGHRLTGRAGDYLVLQGDGNLVLYAADGHARWSTDPARGDRVAVQRDGNVVLYRDKVAVWSTSTTSPWPPANVELVVQDDGNLVLYSTGARWAVTR